MWTSDARSRLAWVRIRDDDLHDRRVVRDDLGLVGLAWSSPIALDRFERFDQSVNPADGAVAAVDGPLDVGLGCEHEADRVIRRLRELCADGHRRLIGHGHLQAVVIEPDRHRLVLCGRPPRG